MLNWMSPPKQNRENVEISIFSRFFICFYVKNKNAVFSRFLEVENAKNNFIWVKIGLKMG